MSQFTLKFILGAPSKELPGQWIEGSVEFGEQSFTLSADVCRTVSAEEFSMYHLHEPLDQPFKAELFLGVLSLIAEDEFRPSASGFDLYYCGEGAAPTDEIARILEPEVRASANTNVVPVSTAESLRSQMRRINVIRRLQRGMARLNA